MQSSLYQGETPAISRAPQGQTPTTHPMQQLWDQNTARATQNAYNLEDTIVDYIEDTRTQQLKTEQNQIEADLKDDLTRALSLANGAPGSPFKKDGLPNETAIRSLINKHQSRIKNWESGYLSLQGAETAARAQQEFRTSIGNTVRATITSALKPRALSAFKNNYNYAIDQGRTQDAIASVDDLYNKGYIDEAEAALYKLDAQEKGINYQIAHLQNFEEADSIYNNPDFTRDCTAAQLRALEETLDRFAAQSLPPGTILKSGRKAGSTNPQDYEKTAPLPPAGLPFYMQNIWANNSGDFSTKNPNGRQMANVAAFRWAMDTIPTDNPESPQWEALFRTQAAAFGISESTASAAITEARNALTANTAPSFKQAIEAIPATSLIHWLSADDMDIIAAETSGNDKYKDLPTDELKEKAARRWYYYNHLKMRVSKEAAELFEQSPDITPEAFQTALAKSQRNKIETEYTAWLANSKNAKASYEMKLQQLNHIINKHVLTIGHRAKIDSSMEPYLNIARQADAERQIRRKNILNQQEQTRQKTEQYQLYLQNQADYFHPLSYADQNITALPYSTTAPVIYVPPGFTELGEIGQDVPVVDPSSGKPIAARIMEVDGIKSPTISSVLSRQFRLYKRKGAPLTITRSQGRILITPAPIEADSYQQAEQGIISPTNQLFPEEDDGLVPIEEAEPVASAYPEGDLPL